MRNDTNIKIYTNAYQKTVLKVEAPVS
jgi:hypothetical protein